MDHKAEALKHADRVAESPGTTYDETKALTHALLEVADSVDALNETVRDVKEELARGRVAR
jgi:hypothetical protein